MARCNQCGAELPDYYASCPNCGGQVTQNTQPQQPYAQPYAQPTGGYIPRSEQRTVTSMGGWFCWLLLCNVLPIVGPIIMMLTAGSRLPLRSALLPVGRDLHWRSAPRHC